MLSRCVPALRALRSGRDDRSGPTASQREPMDIKIPQTLAEWNAAGAAYLPRYLGLTFLEVEPHEVIAKLTARKELGAWNGYLHAGAVVTLADTCCGYGTVRSLPAGATGFTTVELKSNFFSSAREGVVVCVARPLHQGRTTQVWDATVTPEGSTKPIRPVPQHATDPVAEGMKFRRLGQAKRRPNAGRDCGLRWVIADARPNLRKLTPWQPVAISSS